MSQRNSTIFPFPAVQYIPLPITNLESGPISKINRSKPLLKLIAGPELVSWKAVLERDYGIFLPGGFPPGTCPVCAIHLRITEVKYRSFFVTMLGTEDPGRYQIFTIPADLFYKQKLFFQVFDPVSAKKLADYSLFMPQGANLKANLG